MNGAEHYAEAERLLELAEELEDGHDYTPAIRYRSRAQIHATLAAAQAKPRLVVLAVSSELDQEELDRLADALAEVVP